jgi:hypothetical protein
VASGNGTRTTTAYGTRRVAAPGPASGPAADRRWPAPRRRSRTLVRAHRSSTVHPQWDRAASLQLREGNDSALATYRKHGRIVDGGAIERTEQRAARAWLADTLAGRRSLLIVDTNDQAARLPAQLRAELIRLGRLEEAGVPASTTASWKTRPDGAWS